MKKIGRIILTYSTKGKIKKIESLGKVTPVVDAKSKTLNLCNYIPEKYNHEILYFDYTDSMTTMYNYSKVASQYIINKFNKNTTIYSLYKGMSSDTLISQTVKERISDAGTRIRRTEFKDGKVFNITCEARNVKDKKLYKTIMTSNVEKDLSAPLFSRSVEDLNTNITTIVSDTYSAVSKIVKDSFGREIRKEFNTGAVVVNKYDSKGRLVLIEEYNHGGCDLSTTYEYEYCPKQVKSYVDGKLVKNEMYSDKSMTKPLTTFLIDAKTDMTRLCQITKETVENNEVILTVDFFVGDRYVGRHKMFEITPYILDDSKEED